MNNEQKRALKALERAFSRCFSAGVAIRGQSANLVAWSDAIYTDVEPGGDMSDGVLVDSMTVNHGGCFVDSGADDELYGRLTEFGRAILATEGSAE